MAKVRVSSQGELPTDQLRSCLDRCQFLLVGGAGAVTTLLGELFPGRVFAQDERRRGRFVAYPRKMIGRLSQLLTDQPAEFMYPDSGPHAASFLVKLGRKAGGGVGAEQDVVAFNALCTPEGVTVRALYDAESKVTGPCIRRSTFDLTRHGMNGAAHATVSLPQIVLELEDDHIHAVGILGQVH